jgi:hypothetical protein
MPDRDDGSTYFQVPEHCQVDCLTVIWSSSFERHEIANSQVVGMQPWNKSNIIHLGDGGGIPGDQQVATSGWDRGCEAQRQQEAEVRMWLAVVSCGHGRRQVGSVVADAAAHVEGWTCGGARGSTG